MTDKAFAQADPDWLALISAARDWLSGPLGQFLLDEESAQSPTAHRDG